MLAGRSQGLGARKEGADRQFLPEKGLGEKKGHWPLLRGSDSSLPEGLYVRLCPRYRVSVPEQDCTTHGIVC